MQILIDRKADVNTVAQDGYTPLMLAAMKGNTKIVEMLIATGENISVFRNDGTSILALSKNRQIAQILIDLYRSQLEVQYPENQMEFLADDFEQCNGDVRLQLMADAFNQVTERILYYIPGKDYKNFASACRLFSKAVSIGRHEIKKKLFSQFITPAIQAAEQSIKKSIDEQHINIQDFRKLLKDPSNWGFSKK